MRSEDISLAMNETDESFIESAGEIRKPKAKKSPWLKYAATAAAIALVVFAGINALTPNELVPEDNNDFPLNTNGDTEYGGFDLPKLVFEENGTTAYGFEGYLAYDISELENGNPWNENMVFKTLPVYKNTSYNEVGLAYPGIGEEVMLEKLNAITGGEHGKIEYSYIGDFTEGTGIPDDFVDHIEADFGYCTIEVQSNGGVVIKYNNYDGIPLPDDISFTYTETSEGDAYRAISYICQNYCNFIDGANTTFVTSGDYTFDGEFSRNYSIYDFSGDNVSNMLNFAFSEIQLAPNDEGKLMLIRINDKLSCAEKIGDYPIISVSDATDMLIDGGYITTVPYEMPGEKYIAKVELIYRSSTSENIWMPYYRFLVELPEMAQENGLKNFGAYYVPAVETEYISGLPLWNGSFN